MSGAIPPALGSLTNLLWLILYDNQLSGHILPALGDLAGLLILNLSTNDLAGALPQPLTALPLSALDSVTGLCAPPDAGFQSWPAGITDVSGTGVTCSPQAVAVAITQESGDIVLAWTPAEPNTGYEVHQAATPYFTPDAGTLAAALPASATEYLLAGAAAGPARFYIVRSKFQDSANYLWVESPRTGTFSYGLVAGR